MAEGTLLFPCQMFDPHPAVVRSRAVIFLEDSLTFGDPHVGLKFHQQKMVLHRASMKQYAATLNRRGYRVIYRDHRPGKTVEDEIAALAREGFDALHYCQPVDFLLEKRLGRCRTALEIALFVHETPMFLSSEGWLTEQLAGKDRVVLADFYREQRRRLGILVTDEGLPRGGRWSFDEDNRRPMPAKGLEVPRDPTSRSTSRIEEAVAYVQEFFAPYFGCAEDFAYPVSHGSAERWLDRFLEERFHLFGDYEDALSRRERVLFHSVLTPMMNAGLLTPGKVIERALDHARAEKTPLNSLEGFVRQIIGWREFVRGVYQNFGVATRNGNFWEFEDRPMPQAFYEGSTGIDPLDAVIERVQRHGWCHHIERLMVIGNFMLLCEIHPRRVYQWFMEMFVDAADWVMVPNVYGMSQFADGGRFTSKPYISGSNYLRKMSDYPAGEWCAVWDGLFWRFIKKHEEFFRGQHRMRMMAAQLDRMKPETLEGHLSVAEDYLTTLW